jgi:prevent-host-death family protein
LQDCIPDHELLDVPDARFWLCGSAVTIRRRACRAMVIWYNVTTSMVTKEGGDVMRVGVRELKNQATEILRQVRENQAEYVVTYYGRPVAVLLPVDEEWLAEEAERAAEAARSGEEVAAELEKLRQEIDRSWQSDKTAVELVSEQRR